MLPRTHSDRIQMTFDDHRLVNNAGLILPATLALRLGLPQLLRKHLDLGYAPGRANTGDKMMTLVASALGGGDCIDDADALRIGRTAYALGCVVKAPSTLGTFLRSFRWGHVRQLDRVSRQLLARAWAAGGLPLKSSLWIWACAFAPHRRGSTGTRSSLRRPGLVCPGTTSAGSPQHRLRANSPLSIRRRRPLGGSLRLVR